MNLATIKDLVSQASLEIGITQLPVQRVFGSADQDVVQMAYLLNAVADEVLLEEPYRVTLGDHIWVSDLDGNPKIVPTVDTDLVLFDKRLAVNGLKYRFLQAKGLEFAEQLRDYTVRMNKLASAANARVLDLYEDESRQQ
jgi:hypothetical protein